MLGLRQQSTMPSATHSTLHAETPVCNPNVAFLATFLEGLQLSTVRPLSAKDMHAKADLVKVFADLGFVMTEDRHQNFYLLARHFLGDEMNRIQDQRAETAALIGAESFPDLNVRDTLEYIAVNFGETFGERIWPADVNGRGHLRQLDAPVYGVEGTGKGVSGAEEGGMDMYTARKSTALCQAVGQYLRVSTMLRNDEDNGEALTEETADALVGAIVAVSGVDEVEMTG
ncbi:hypothetical protein CLAFUW4_08331 [Fulvia fulva]|uniref:Uncharacterized protein n=1 Tax=Passalora fulva TaxID=5499 RepID=A0A9Q8P695_PASFU|nr:uncharacterized protein CLAFUR5_08439 [Fulvia fulva]KAK4629610.1 hypothetical protein CLAFUR4_08336 [Fulvia fulva]KAK4630219.1 hypothetical protein CLAFUR0_08331 [Fulvia fulva]UJO14925.1 hypothetical protein CLAFUR5_08439 [Fulvia fulva]WPV12614.1 hypothetical protein CLAFUW4_08331 [Fulvia fulva]WPV27850.1 hypothetical protein CLAFUW7_08331 [Fulvia fulva]